MLETITTFKTITLWKDLLISNLSDALDGDGDGDGDYHDGDGDDDVDVGGTTLICWRQQKNQADGLHLFRVSSCNPVSSSSQLQPIRTFPEGTSAVFSGRRDPCIT